MMNAKKTVNKNPQAAPQEGVEVSKDDALLEVLAGISTAVGSIDKRMSGLEDRVKDIETGGKERFKQGAREEDIKLAAEHRVGVDPKLAAIVDELLGEDFGIKISEFSDKPGFLFSLIVPPRLSDNVTDKRPKVNPENPNEYLKDSMGNVIFEDYMPEDRRSRAISSLGSYDAIRQHCERVRAYIVSYFQKTQKPLPEFRVK